MAVNQIDDVSDCMLLNGAYCSRGQEPATIPFASTISRNGSNIIRVQEVSDLTEWVVVFIVTPSISVFGVIGNILSLIILAKHGLHKSSNILLFSLAVSHILFVIAINASPKSLSEWGAGVLPYPELTVHVLYYLYQLADCLRWITGPTSVSIPVLIMVERLIAVFLPRHFPSLVTVRRTVIAIIIPLVFSTLLQVYARTWCGFAYVYKTSRNMSIGVADITHRYWDHQAVRATIEVCMNLFFILVFFVGCGCIAIGVKMKLVAKKRMKINNNLALQKASKTHAESSRTTKMLLCLCISYTCACMPFILSAILPSFMTYAMFLDKPNNRSVEVFVYHVYNLVFCVNASCNFFIYVGTNKKFRQTLVDILCGPRCRVFRILHSIQ
ncbi:hypothetical protein BsWGS_11271 [Bradybaena similaris]